MKSRDCELVKSLLTFKEKASVKVGEDDVDIYLAKNVYPVLLPGLEHLAMEVEKYQEDADNKLDKRIKNRFNPAIFLGEFLMRNNPNCKSKPVKEKIQKMQDLFRTQANQEAIRRIIQPRKSQMFKLLQKQKYADKLNKQSVSVFMKQLDKDMRMGDKLCKGFETDKFFISLVQDEVIQFEAFFNAFLKWIVQQKSIQYRELERAFELKFGRILSDSGLV